GRHDPCRHDRRRVSQPPAALGCVLGRALRDHRGPERSRRRFDESGRSDQTLLAARGVGPLMSTPDKIATAPRERPANHILPNAATMIGICVTLIGLVKIAEAHIGPSRVDEYSSLAAITFLLSAGLSYVALRLTPDSPSVTVCERLADALFMLGL